MCARACVFVCVCVCMWDRSGTPQTQPQGWGVLGKVVCCGRGRTGGHKALMDLALTITPNHPRPHPVNPPFCWDLTSFGPPPVSLSSSLFPTPPHTLSPHPGPCFFIRLDVGDSRTLVVSRLLYSPPPHTTPLMQHKIHYGSHYIKIQPPRTHTQSVLSLSCSEDTIRRDRDGLVGSFIHSVRQRGFSLCRLI